MLPGFFGKIPARGDFVRRGLPAAAVEPLDVWMAAVLATGREQLGAAWTERYLSAPLWRFGLSAGVLGPTPMIGVMMPSTDKVGRHFPLMILAALPGATPLHHLPVFQERWFAGTEQVLLHALADDLEPDEIENSLMPVIAVGGGGTAALPRAAQAGSHDFWRSQAAPPWTDPAISSQLALLAGGRSTLWWSTGGAGFPASLALCDGLPGARRALALFDMDATVWGWSVAETDGALRSGAGDP